MNHAQAPFRERRPSGAVMRFDDVEPVTVVLVRHGETAMTVGKALSGSSEPGPPLSATGRDQVGRAAAAVASMTTIWPDLPAPSSVVASPMVRTQESGRILADRLDVPMSTDPAFAECDFGHWQGRTPAEVEQGWPGDLRRWYEGRIPAPGGEALADVGERVGRGLARLVEGGTARTVVVAAHVMAIRAAVGVSLQIPVVSWTWLRVLPASLSVLQCWPDGTCEVVTAGSPT